MGEDEVEDARRPAGNPGGASVGETQPTIDLREPETMRWEAVAVPAGWEPIAQVARDVESNLDPLVTRITTCIADEIPSYRAGVVPLHDLRTSVDRNLTALLVGLAENRGPTRDEVTVRRELGRRRALQGLPVDALIQAYHVGYRELWLALVEAAADHDHRASTLLLSAATTVWRWVHEITDALAAAHATTIRSLEARAVGARQRLVELLATGDVDGAEATALARTLALDVEGEFRVVVVESVGDDLDAVRLQHDLEPIRGRHAVVARGHLVVIVTQGSEVAGVAAACRVAFPGAAIAAGATRTGLRGARASLEDAEQTLRVVDGAGTATFEEAWLWATLAGRGERLEPVLRPGIPVAREHPHLAAAVVAFADGGFSVSEAARQLQLHANTVAYRLDRWEALTGWDPRSFPGLVRSLAALRLPR